MPDTTPRIAGWSFCGRLAPDDLLVARWTIRCEFSVFFFSPTMSAHGAARRSAWLIIVLTVIVCVEVFKRYILNAPTAWIFECRRHDVRHAVHDVRRLYAGAERPCARRFPLRLDEAAHAGLARPRALHRLLPAGDRGARLCRLGLRARVLGDRRACQRHCRRTARLSFQGRHPHCRRARAAAGHRRDRPLHRLHQDRRVAGAAEGRRRDRRRRGATGGKHVRRRGIARAGDRARARDRRSGASARHGRRRRSYERSDTRAADAQRSSSWSS